MEKYELKKSETRRAWAALDRLEREIEVALVASRNHGGEYADRYEALEDLRTAIIEAAEAVEFYENEGRA